MKKIIIFVFYASLFISAQEYSVSTPGHMRGKEIITECLDKLEMKESDITVPYQVLEKNFLSNDITAGFLREPLFYLNAIENAMRDTNNPADIKRVLGLIGITETNTAGFLKSAHSAIQSNMTLYNTFTQKYSNEIFFKIADGGFDDSLIPDLSTFSKYKRLTGYLKYEESFRLKEELFKELDALYKRFQIPAFFISSLDCKMHEITALFPGIAFIEGSTGNDIHTVTNSSFILHDPGGDDIYRIRSLREPGHIAIIIDDSGNDMYIGDNHSIGFSYFGISFIHDKKGDDVYKGGVYSIASTIGGISVLIDREGHDLYQGKEKSEAFSFLGYALLHDKSGNDKYLLLSDGQALSGIGGTALLLDEKGNDLYYAKGGASDNLRYKNRTLSFAQGASIGYRPFAWGGIALLADLNGNDKYEADNFAQGVSYWCAVGGLIDAGGNDTYQAQQYAQASGIHLGVGFLMDSIGNDRYSSYSVSLGCGHDLSVAYLLDAEGNDRTEVYDLGI
ncbi:hypothetical protein ACFL6D_01795, partial [Spirochaetota bacterium]